MSTCGPEGERQEKDARAGNHGGGRHVIRRITRNLTLRPIRTDDAATQTGRKKGFIHHLIKLHSIKAINSQYETPSAVPVARPK